MAHATPRLIDRADLLAALDRAAARMVTVISAPAGSGKTSLLRAWADAQGERRRLAVLQVQRDQQDAQQFWLALLDAVRRRLGRDRPRGPAGGDPRVQRAGDGRPGAGGLGTHPAGLTLIIDDLHELTSPEALAQLSRLLTNLPPGAHALLTTRHDLRLGLHQLRLAGELAEIRAADLRFTERETRLLLAASGIDAVRVRGGAAAPADRGVGGGPAAGGDLPGRPPRPGAFRGGVLRQRPHGRRVPDRRDAGAPASRRPGPAAAHLAARPGQRRAGRPAHRPVGLGADAARLADANAFVLPLDPERTWFRYHHLFGDLLRLELRRTLPTEVPALHRRAAGWFVRQGRVVDAIRHTQAAGDWADAARLLADHSFSLTLDGQAQTMQALAAGLPARRGSPRAGAGARRRRPGSGTPRRGGRPPGGRRDVRRDGAAGSPAPPPGGDRVAASCRWPGGAATWPASLEQVRFLASPVTGQSDEDIALGSDLRAVALMNLGTVEAWTLGLPDAERHLRQGAALAREIGRPYLEVGCLAAARASRRRSTRSPSPSGAAARRSRSPSGTAGAPNR